jgi:phosphoglycolate phosphatase-like HAD superfamily hydrolase
VLYVYDLDGTLIDSKRAVVEAYKAAGINPPDDFWGKPFSAWCDANVAHERKNDLYPEMLKKYGKRLPTADLMAETGGHILTGASYDATLYALGFLGLMTVVDCIYDSCDDATKLRQLEKLGESGFYFDDDFRFCQRVRELTKWQAIHVL